MGLYNCKFFRPFHSHKNSEFQSNTATPAKIGIIFILYYKDLFTHKDINTYINGVVKICLNKFFFFFWKHRFPKEKRKNMQNYAQIENNDFYSLHNIFIISVIT